MEGYDVDFGHMEAVSLISAPKYPEKQDEKNRWGYLFESSLGIKLEQSEMKIIESKIYILFPALGILFSLIGSRYVGYIVTSCLLNENHDFLRLAINTVRNDIIGRNETFQCLALTLDSEPLTSLKPVGNIGGRDFAESLAPDVQKLLVSDPQDDMLWISSSCRPLVRKKAALCLLRLFRKNPDAINVDGADRMAQLLDERDLGVLTSSTSLLVALVSNNHEAYSSCLPKCVKILERLARNQDVPQEYTYYGIPSPWLQVKAMRALQYFPTIEDPSTRKSLFEVLQRILMGTDVVKNVNKNNASHAVLFEALSLVMHLDAEKEMMSQCVALLGKFISVREPNIRYLGLENMTRMLMVTDVQDIIKKHQSQIITSLKDPDISIRRRALDLLYGMCDVSNAKDIVEELLQYLSTAEFSMREELSLKAAILAEKFAPDLSWYVDVILQLIDKAGDFVSDDIWFRVVQFVTNNEDLQDILKPYAASKAREYLDKIAIHETMVKVSAYILGEYGHLLARQPGCSANELFSILHEKLPTVTTPTIPILLSSYAKLLMHAQPPDPELQKKVWAVFRKYESSIDVEIQQRAVEYFELSKKGDAFMDVLAEMPKFPERQSSLIKKAEDVEDTADQSAIKLRAQQQPSNALVLTDPQPVTGAPPPLKVPTVTDRSLSQPNGSLSSIDPQTPSADLLSDLLGPLAIEAPPGTVSTEQHGPIGAEGAPDEADGSAIVPLDEQTNTVEVIGNIAERFHALCLKDSGVLYEDPYIQAGLLLTELLRPIGLKAEWRGHHGRLVLFLGNKSTSPLTSVQALILPPAHLKLELSPVPDTIPPRAQVQSPLEVMNIRPSRDVAVLDFSYKFGTNVVSAKLRIPAVLNKFLQPLQLTSEEFFPQWRALSGPPLKLQEVIRGVRPLALPEMANLFNSFRVTICPGLDPNPNNLVASTTFYSESTGAMLCLARIETDPADRTQLRMTVGSGDPTLTFELKEFIKEHLITIPTGSRALVPATGAAAPPPPPPVAQPPSPAALADDPGAMLAGLL
ncbi:unnamed protein product [Thlaspi arvense]|uniref:AP-2 complex subunit alpha n=1 Tax=Thlaspi arvense TaxID=13288 RepID=A0AAU9SSC5_THLAR|nr:unnamed protein product [Thlaspi arvense]